MELVILDPLADPRWAQLAANYSSATVFHTPGWLQALQRTYGHTPLAVCLVSQSGEVTGGAAFCLVRSALTGNRCVSIPFADHCDPLVDSQADLQLLLNHLQSSPELRSCRYTEIRFAHSALAPESARQLPVRQVLHRLDLRPELQDLFRRFHASCIQRRIRRAEAAGLDYETGNNESLLRRFYALMVETRSRQHLPPQSYAWFQNLAACLGECLQVHLLSMQGEPAASILTLRHASTVTYKYGCSRQSYHHLGVMPLLLWKTIQQAKADALEWLDLGRSDVTNPGLIQFKNRLGAAQSPLFYWRGTPQGGQIEAPIWRGDGASRLLRLVPQRWLPAAGRLLYPHLHRESAASLAG